MEKGEVLNVKGGGQHDSEWAEVDDSPNYAILPSPSSIENTMHFNQYNQI